MSDGSPPSPQLAAPPEPAVAQRIQIPDGELAYWPGLWPIATADQLRDQLLQGLGWECHRLRLFGREVASPRLSAWYGDPGCVYSYSGLSLQPLTWTPTLMMLRDQVQDVAHCQFNSVLANLYRDGADSMGWHSDDEPELGNEPTIASVSLGGSRRFLLRHKQDKSLAPVELLLGHGDLLLMRGPTQRCWKHALPKTRKPVEPRINLTFRQVYIQPG